MERKGDFGASVGDERQGGCAAQSDMGRLILRPEMLIGGKWEVTTVMAKGWLLLSISDVVAADGAGDVPGERYPCLLSDADCCCDLQVRWLRCSIDAP